jgi:hypothetical protein
MDAPTSNSPSGSAYVTVTMRQPDSQEDRGLGKVTLRKPQNCGHVETMCVECARQWNWDYVLLLHRTAGGRQLRDELPEGWDAKR